jgi:hypothetical protein
VPSFAGDSVFPALAPRLDQPRQRVRRTAGLDGPAPLQLELLITGAFSVCTSYCTSCTVPAGPRTAHAQGNLSGQSAWQFAGGWILRRPPPPLLRPPQVGGPWGSLRGAAEMVQPLQYVAPVTGPGSLPFALHHCPQRHQAASLPCGRSWKRRGAPLASMGGFRAPRPPGAAQTCAAPTFGDCCNQISDGWPGASLRGGG